MSLRKIALGTAAMSSVSVLRLLAQFLVVPILSRLLAPEDYGVVAMAMPFVLFTMIFTDGGMGQSLVRADSNKAEVWSTSFWLTILLGLGLGLFIALLAPLAAAFFNEARLLPIILALSALVVFQAGATIPEAVLRQRHKFGTIAATEMTAVAAGISTAVFIGMNGGGAWALVGQQLALYILRFVMTFWFSGFRPRLIYTFKEVKEHLIFGRDVIGSNLINYVGQTSDSFVIGKFLGSAVLGIYSMAFLFVRLPLRMIAGPLQYVIYAHLSPLRHDTELMRRIFLLLTRVLAILLYPSIGLVAAACHPVFTLLLSEKWAQSGLLFMIAAPAGALQAVTGLRSTFLLALGKTQQQLKTTLEGSLIQVFALCASVYFGVTWVVVAFTVATFIYFPRAMTLMLPLIECSFVQYLRTMFWPVLTTITAVIIYDATVAMVVLTDIEQVLLGGTLGCLAMLTSIIPQYNILKTEASALRLMLTPKK